MQVTVEGGLATEKTLSSLLAASGVIPGVNATLSNVAASTSSVTILASNASRNGGILVNDSTSICYVKFGSTASSTSFSVEMPGRTAAQSSILFLENAPNYIGIITAIWVTATGSMRVTEFA
jgi:hypothetical protein